MKPMMVEDHHGEITPQDQETVTYVETQTAVITKSESHRLKRLQWLLLISFYFSCSAIGAIGGPLLQRLYYMHGGTRKWLSCFLQSSGFPLLLIPLAIFYYRTASTNNSTGIIIHEFFMDTTLFFFAVASGLICGLSNYFYAAGLVYLPVSTSSLLFSSQLAFTAVSAFFIVRQRFSFCSLNAVVVITMGSVVLALHTSGDRPDGVSEGKYVSGFFMTLGSAALTGVFLPIIELAYRKSSHYKKLGLRQHAQDNKR